MIQFFSILSNKKVFSPLLIIMDGQSNNGGHGNISELPSYLNGQISPNVRIWDGTNASILEAGVNQMGQMILSAGGAWYDYWHGSELELAYRLSIYYPNREIFFVKTGRGGRPLGQDSGIEDFSELSSNELHQYLIDNVTNFLNNQNKFIDEFEVWYLWMQGEYDCRTGQDVKANAYETNLKSKLTAVKQDLGINVWKIIINVIPSWVDRDINLIPIVRNAQMDVSNSMSNAWYQLSENWTEEGDNVHFDSAGQIQKGYGEYNIIINNS